MPIPMTGLVCYNGIQYQYFFLSEVAESLTKFDADGTIDYYDAYGNKLVVDESATSANMTVEEVLNNTANNNFDVVVNSN